jgi:hypothetical protein
LPAGDWRIGQTLRLADGRSGRITELAQRDGGIEALAVLNLAAAETPGESEEPAATVTTAALLPLPYQVGGAAL